MDIGCVWTWKKEIVNRYIETGKKDFIRLYKTRMCYILESGVFAVKSTIYN